tara:strand:+ start:7816 stop:9177 length:1362 start_codon:yes stop_codon:yes gene_type:complete
MKKNFLVGSSQEDITPKNIIPLYSLDHKLRSSKKIQSRIYLNTIFLSINKKKVLFITLDLIYVGEDFCNKLKKQIKSKFKINTENIMINATHTHSSPLISETIFNSAKISKNYISFLNKKILTSIVKSIKNKTYCKINYGAIDAEFNVNRRKKILDLSSLKNFRLMTKFANRPNFYGPKDSKLSVINFLDKNNSIKCMIFNYACHPSLSRFNSVSADYPGFTREYIRKYYSKNMPICFLLGFCGNLKSNLIFKRKISFKNPIKSFFEIIFDKYQFDKNLSLNKIKKFSNKISRKIFGINNFLNIKPNINCKEVNLKLFYENYNYQNLYQNIKQKNQFEIKNYLKFIKKNKYKNFKTLKIQKISIAKNLSFISLSGEVFCEYSIWLKKLSKQKSIFIIPVMCANGIMGYVPTSTALEEGGYEVERSLIEHGMPAKFTRHVEKRIYLSLKKLILN